ncbi:sensor histidine kinase [Propionibacterium australiense]|uniref:histidine kinase n=1 Tax=Propionibacterium australiense TaxID=119981 RepID=A0A383S809_9ACTN|nr:HAMP domain-containing sensor histidine kinase [Propionibacterium australiense]RLP06737.1 sensor histidine kinase [Propionibacterium australiense]RLP07504.1 sensor histidine kinase [Propionibacterium australiense]SYZ34108.1 histidine kinase [Propionibacterium australiense]VEH88697.1 Sensor histidine kinase YycG [Propionibacterium australiense]
MTGWIAAGVMAFAAILFARRARRLRGRVGELRAQVAARRSSGVQEPLVVDTRDDELEALAAEIDLAWRDGQERLAQAERREGRLRREIANISHDLKTPMIAVKGYLQLVERDGPQAVPGRLEIVLARVDDLSRLVDDFFELSVLDSADHTLRIERADATALVSQVLIGFQTHFAAGGVEPVVALPSVALPVRVDVTAFTRIITNLVSNALVHGGGPLRVALSRDGDVAVLAVTNQTTGLTEADVQHLFERSWRADPARGGPHAGLGLSIVAELVDRMSGTVHAALDDEDLVFTVRLPLAE